MFQCWTQPIRIQQETIGFCQVLRSGDESSDVLLYIMNAAPEDLQLVQGETSQKPPFLVVIIYEDDITFERAEPLYQRLLRDFSHETHFNCQFANFQALSVPQVAADTAEHAARADLVVFSCHARREFPTSVKDWIDTWLPHKSLEDSALAALVGIQGENPAEAAAIQEYLHTIAKRGHMEFLPQSIQADNVPAKELPVVTDYHRNNVSFLTEIEEHRYLRHWGIND